MLYIHLNIFVYDIITRKNGNCHFLLANTVRKGNMPTNMVTYKISIFKYF